MEGYIAGGKLKSITPLSPLWFYTQKALQVPTRLAASTVDNTVGKLRAILNSADRNGPWNDLFGIGNPASDKSIQDYLRFTTKEQTAAHVSPKQAISLFFDKLSKLIRYLISQAFTPNYIPPIQRFIFARDAAFFCADFFSGNTGSDLGRSLTKEVLYLPDKQGLIFRQSSTKLCVAKIIKRSL